MKSVEREEDIISLQLETVDKEGTYEQKRGGDLGNKTIYSGNAKVIAQKKKKIKQLQKVIFTN